MRASPAVFVVSLSFLELTGCPKGDAAATDAAPASSASAGPTASASAASTQVDTASFTGAMRGTLDAKHAIVMHLMHTGSSATAVEGYYYYVPSIDDLKVHGSALADGTVHLDETSNGKPTGAFDGHLNGQDSLDGTWTDPKKTKSLPFHLDLVREGPNAAAVIVERKQVSKHKPTKPFDKTQFTGDPVCDLSVAFPDILGAITPASEEIKVDQALRDNVTSVIPPCEAPFVISGSYNIRVNFGGVLSVTQGSGNYQVGMPSGSAGTVFTNLSLPSGKPFALKDVLTPAGITLVDARITASLPKDLDNDSKQAVKDAMASDPPDFAITRNGIVASIFTALPHAFQGLGDQEVPVSTKDLESLRVHPSPVDVLWGK